MIEDTVPRLLVTGKNGQVGRELVEIAEAKGVDVIAFGLHELNICDRDAVMGAMTIHKPDEVINAAAYAAVDKAEEESDSAFTVNCAGVENLALGSKEVDALLIHISTDYVFDGSKAAPYVESDIPKPNGVYGASKLAGEEVLKSTWAKHIMVRVSWVFGQHGANFVKTMLRLAAERDQLSVVSDQHGGPTAAVDIENVILGLALKNTHDFGVFHLSSNPEVSWYEFAQSIFSEAKK